VGARMRNQEVEIFTVLSGEVSMMRISWDLWFGCNRNDWLPLLSMNTSQAYSSL